MKRYLIRLEAHYIDSMGRHIGMCDYESNVTGCNSLYEGMKVTCDHIGYRPYLHLDIPNECEFIGLKFKMAWIEKLIGKDRYLIKSLSKSYVKRESCKLMFGETWICLD